MNKKIKVIELLNRIHQNKDIPKKLKKNDYIFEYCEEEQDFYNEKHSTFLFCDYAQSHSKWLDIEVEILEDEEEIDIKDLEDLPLNYKEVSELSIDSTFIDFHNNTRAEINKIIKYLKQLDKKINKED